MRKTEFWIERRNLCVDLTSVVLWLLFWRQHMDAYLGKDLELNLGQHRKYLINFSFS